MDRIFDFSSGPGNTTVFLSQYGSDSSDSKLL